MSLLPAPVGNQNSRLLQFCLLVKATVPPFGAMAYPPSQFTSGRDCSESSKPTDDRDLSNQYCSLKYFTISQAPIQHQLISYMFCFIFVFLFNLFEQAVLCNQTIFTGQIASLSRPYSEIKPIIVCTSKPNQLFTGTLASLNRHYSGRNQLYQEIIL